MGYSPCSLKESDTTERLSSHADILDRIWESPKGTVLGKRKMDKVILRGDLSLGQVGYQSIQPSELGDSRHGGKGS